MKKIFVVLVSVLALSLSAREFKDVINAQAAQIERVSNEDVLLELPKFVFSHTNTKIGVRFKNPMHDKLVSNGYKLHFIVNGNDELVQFNQDGTGNITCTFKADNKLNVLFEDVNFTRELSVISIWYLILPLVGLFLFLGYKLTFSRRKMTVITNNTGVSEQKADPAVKSNLKLVKEEEEVLV
jgi:hypothetical protein